MLTAHRPWSIQVFFWVCNLATHKAALPNINEMQFHTFLFKTWSLILFQYISKSQNFWFILKTCHVREALLFNLCLSVLLRINLLKGLGWPSSPWTGPRVRQKHHHFRKQLASRAFTCIQCQPLQPQICMVTFGSFLWYLFNSNFTLWSNSPS